MRESRNWKIEVNSVSETELGGIKEISFTVNGEGAYSRLKFEGGTHRVQRVPETETQGRIHTSAATVAVMPEAEEVELELDPKDLQIDTFRSSGAGGQHINKTSSAIRVTHLPTGMVVECQDERSQYKNKDKALRVLRSRLLQQKQAAQHAEISAERKSQVGTGDRSGRIRTYNFPQGRVTDHRIGLTLYKLDAVLDGDLDEVHRRADDGGSGGKTQVLCGGSRRRKLWRQNCLPPGRRQWTKRRGCCARGRPWASPPRPSTALPRTPPTPRR